MSAVKRVCYCIIQLMVISTCVEFAKPQQSADEGAEGQAGVSPYMLVSRYNSVERVTPWPYVPTPGTPEPLFTDEFGIPGFEGLAYHYRLGRMYWAIPDVFDPQIKSANLDGTDVVIISTGVGRSSHPADVTVDWINDKLYWVDRNAKKIVEYDLKTGFIRNVYSTGARSLPTGLVVYPFPNYGWLYWTDNEKATIERVSVRGDDHMIIRDGLIQGCIGPISLEYLSHTVYWIDNCDNFIRSITISESQVISNRPIVRPGITEFSHGLTLYKDIVYWTETNNVYGYNVTAGGDVELVQSGSQLNGFRGVKIVQPLSQPGVEMYVEMILNSTTVEAPVCAVECVNGLCVPPGLCACNRGWTGVNCTTDINECDIQNHGCEETCINVVGSFLCSCPGRAGYVVAEDGEDCVDLDECEVLEGACVQNCTNTIGSFNCSCFDGYTVTLDGTNCTLTQSTTVLLLPSSTTTVLSTQPITPPTSTVAPVMSSTFKPSTSSMIFGLSTAVTHPLASSEAPVSTTVSLGPVPILSTSVFSSMLTQSTVQSDNILIPMSSSFIPMLITSTPTPSSTNTPIISTVESSTAPLVSTSVKSSRVSSSRVTVLLSTMSSLPTPTTSTSITLHTQSSSKPVQIVSSLVLSSLPRPSATPISSSSVEELYTREASVSTPLSVSSSLGVQLSTVPTPSPGLPVSTDGTQVSESEFPLVVVISSGVVGGAVVFVAIVLIVVVAFGCYVRKTTGSYNFPVEKSSKQLEGGTVRASKIVFQAPPLLDSNIFGADNKSPFCNGNGASPNGHLNRNETISYTSENGSSISSGTIVITSSHQ